MALNAVSRSQRRIGPGAALGLIGLCVLWGLGQVAIKIGNGGISPLLQAGLRSLGATVLVLIWCRLRGVRVVEHDTTLRPGVIAGLMFAAEFLLLYCGLQYTTAARGAMFLYTSPFFVAIGAHLVIAGERLTATRIAGLTVAFAGIVIAFSDGLQISTAHLYGDAMCIGAALAWGATTVVVKASRLATIRPERTLLYQLVVSSAALLIAALVTGEPGLIDVTPLVIGALAYQMIVVAFFTYLMWFWYLANYPASSIASFTFLTPICGVVAGALLLNEPITASLIVALVLIAGGIYIINRPR